MFGPNNKTKTFWILIVLLIVFLGIAFFKSGRVIEIPINSAGIIKLKPPSVISAIVGSKCVLTYKTRENKEGRLELLQTFWEWPITVIASTNQGVFFCLYYNDVDIQLLRIDTQHRFKALSSRRPISHIVLTASCEVDEPSGEDWEFALKRLRQMTSNAFKRQSLPNIDFGIVKIYGDPQDYAERMESSDEIAYDGDNLFPDPHQKGRWVKHPKP